MDLVGMQCQCRLVVKARAVDWNSDSIVKGRRKQKSQRSSISLSVIVS